jgi:biotin/methionine sulfoxide reductase
MTDVPSASHTSHWGAYTAHVRDDELVGVDPHPDDPLPSPLLGNIVSGNGRARVAHPAIRRGWLEDGPGTDPRRGADEWVTVSWEEALDRTATELGRVIGEHGNAAVYAGSYGWASAGRFHHAQSQVHRFLALGGGYTTSRGSYSVGAMELILPHVIGGGKWSIWERGPMWSEIAEHAELVVSFGGVAAKNAQVNPGGVGRHEVLELQRRCAAKGVRFVSVSPLREDAAGFLDAEWLSLRPNTDVPLMLGIAFALLDEGLHDQDFLERCCHG